MGVFTNFTRKALLITKCRCFAHDECFKYAREILDKYGIDWQEELIKINKPQSLHLNSIMDNVTFYQDRFEILVDIRGFKPEEIKCTVTQRAVEVLAQSEDYSENNQKRMVLSRQYFLPKFANADAGSCCLSSEGVLLVTAPWV
ncbi:protein lethal(2)essential for life-like [Rhynchophorus ferrugineus]|uniref:protein lethal(2)essential for life-like n=1 Tax=Rhynchophorus ferrugineus TaxID=354439 RepID=UPI003FCEB9B4